jgi:transposase
MMPAPLSIDLRERVVAAYEAKQGCFAALGARFQIGEATVNRWVQQFHKTGGIEPRPHGGGNESRIDDQRLGEFVELVHRHSDATLAELVGYCSAEMGISTSSAGVSRALKRANITRKKSP